MQSYTNLMLLQMHIRMFWPKHNPPVPMFSRHKNFLQVPLFLQKWKAQLDKYETVREQELQIVPELAPSFEGKTQQQGLIGGESTTIVRTCWLFHFWRLQKGVKRCERRKKSVQQDFNNNNATSWRQPNGEPTRVKTPSTTKSLRCTHRAYLVLRSFKFNVYKRESR